MLSLLIGMLVFGLVIGCLVGAVRGFRIAWKKSRAVRIIWSIVGAVYALVLLVAIASQEDISPATAKAINGAVFFGLIGAAFYLAHRARRNRKA